MTFGSNCDSKCENCQTSVTSAFLFICCIPQPPLRVSVLAAVFNQCVFGAALGCGVGAASTMLLSVPAVLLAVAALILAL